MRFCPCSDSGASRALPSYLLSFLDGGAGIARVHVWPRVNRRESDCVALQPF